MNDYLVGDVQEDTRLTQLTSMLEGVKPLTSYYINCVLLPQVKVILSLVHLVTIKKVTMQTSSVPSEPKTYLIVGFFSKPCFFSKISKKPGFLAKTPVFQKMCLKTRN